jgi:MFS family permease
MAVSAPILGKLGDQFGKERFLRVSLGLFFSGCVAAIFAWNVRSLIAFRALETHERPTRGAFAD